MYTKCGSALCTKYNWTPCHSSHSSQWANRLKSQIKFSDISAIAVSSILNFYTVSSPQKCDPFNRCVQNGPITQKITFLWTKKLYKNFGNFVPRCFGSWADPLVGRELVSFFLASFCPHQAFPFLTSKSLHSPKRMNFGKFSKRGGDSLSEICVANWG